MPQLRIDRRRQALLECLDSLGNLPQTGHVLLGIAATPLICDRGETVAERRCELPVNFPHRKSLKRTMLSRKRPRMAEGRLKKILIVDDDVGLMRVTREALTSFLHCEVDTSPKPEYGFELALKKTYDLLIFDFSMPMIDGAMLFFLIGKVYENARPVRIVPPLLLISGRADEKRAQELLKEPHVQGLITKPFSINRLLEKVRESVRGMESRGA